MERRALALDEDNSGDRRNVDSRIPRRCASRSAIARATRAHSSSRTLPSDYRRSRRDLTGAAARRPASTTWTERQRDGVRAAHAFGTRMVAAGVPLRTLREWMAHRDYKTTATYADYAPSAHERELASAPARNRGRTDGVALPLLLPAYSWRTRLRREPSSWLARSSVATASPPGSDSTIPRTSRVPGGARCQCRPSCPSSLG